MLKFIQHSDYFICYVIFVMKKYKLHKWMQLITGIDISSILYLFFIFTFQFYPWNKLFLFIDITEKKKSVIWWLVLKQYLSYTLKVPCISESIKMWTALYYKYPMTL